jgi:prolyl-tRNA synthetase
MKLSNFFISTLKEAPSEAEVISHQLMLRAGFIKRLSAGIYTYMPLGLRVIRKVEAIVREEMTVAGAVELLMPLIQPAELWQETGRFDKMGDELLRVSDRHDRRFVVQPTSEEVITDIARQELRSYKSLPKTFFHIQTKFRDERRPRFGVMRGREFTMKDAYSFDRDVGSALHSYDRMHAAYIRIFNRLGLIFRAVAADTGAIGGDRSHEFQVIADAGEDAIVYCAASDYTANIELAEALPLVDKRAVPNAALVKTPTPGVTTCERLAEFLAVPIEKTVKAMVLATEVTGDADATAGSATRVWLLLIRGDHSLNEIKVSKLPGFGDGHRFATTAEIEEYFGCVPGYLGPVELKKPLSVIADRTVAAMSDFICGANHAGYHYTGVNWGRDIPEPTVVADLRNVVEGDPSPDGKGVLSIQRGIEVGHVFYLGTKYSRAMNATFLDDQGKAQFLEMGCYGIGITRILGAAIEQCHDARGMVWPRSIAPFEVVICPIGYDRTPDVRSVADSLHASLIAQGIDAVLDDRGERPGAMFADWELIGVPWRIVVGDRHLKNGAVEIQGRSEVEARLIPLDAVVATLKDQLAG